MKDEGVGYRVYFNKRPWKGRERIKGHSRERIPGRFREDDGVGYVSTSINAPGRRG